MFTFRKKKLENDSGDIIEYKQVSCIISVYNEEGIIIEKINSVLASDYPKDKLKIYIGSDASNDHSAQLIRELSQNNPNIYFYNYNQRRGKALVINDLIDEAFKQTPKTKDHILLFTDANVILTESCISNLCRHFSQEQIALVDSKIIPSNLKKAGISLSENQYMNLEIKIKNMEGELWGAMMGAFGGCFAIRSSYIEKVPSISLVDDFYISLSALSKGGLCMNDLNAICYEGMPGQLKEEFRRKARISAGNFQNLAVFYKLIFKKPFRIGYAFLSHKVLRWTTPILIIIAWLCTALLSLLDYSNYLIWFLLFSSSILFFPILDYILDKLKIHIKIIRGIRYFIMMNIALLFGFINYLKGIRNSSWEPPKRN